MVEHLAFNQMVVGSNPAAFTNTFKQANKIKRQIFNT